MIRPSLLAALLLLAGCLPEVKARPPKDALDGSMPALHWVALMASAFVMLAGVINLFGVEALAGAAAATLVH